MNGPGETLVVLATRAARRHLAGAEQRWVFEPPAADWRPQPVERTSLYLHVPFCRHLCPYCPYTKVPYREDLVEPWTSAALAEIDWWAANAGAPEVTSVYVGGGTPTLALGGVERALDRIRQRFRLTGDVCIETNPGDVDRDTVSRLRDAGIAMVSLGVQSFRSESLAVIGRDYPPEVAERALALLAGGGFASVNADLMFALPGQTAETLIADLDRAAQLGADQLTAYPLFTFPYSSVGRHLRLSAVRMPGLRVRREHYRAVTAWCVDNGFVRVSVWGFKRGCAPRYSSVTRDGYLGIGPGAGSQLPDGFVLNTFDLAGWMGSANRSQGAVALRMPFSGHTGGWWWLYWRLYDTRIPLRELDAALGDDAPRARRWLAVAQRAGWASRRDGVVELTDEGAFWMHLAQNQFALRYVNTLWTEARRRPWPRAVAI